MKKILVVEDSIENGPLLAQILQNNGYSVRLARSGPEAIHLAAECSPNVVLTDYYLTTEMTGAGVVDHLPDVPAIVMTAGGGDVVEAIAKRLPHARVLSKPVATEDLLAVVRAAAG
jgi:CheY-like chemotaxis protein